MTPQEKAKELVDRHWKEMLSPAACEWCFDCEGKCQAKTDAAKQCAIICVDEILNLGAVWFDAELVGKGNLDIAEEDTVEFWQQVKQEIERL